MIVVSVAVKKVEVARVGGEQVYFVRDLTSEHEEEKPPHLDSSRDLQTLPGLSSLPTATAPL